MSDSEVPAVPNRPLTYTVHVTFWVLRRRWLALLLRHRGGTPYDVIAALREDARRHPHPLG